MPVLIYAQEAPAVNVMKALRQFLTGHSRFFPAFCSIFIILSEAFLAIYILRNI